MSTNLLFTSSNEQEVCQRFSKRKGKCSNSEQQFFFYNCDTYLIQTSKVLKLIGFFLYKRINLLHNIIHTLEKLITKTQKQIIHEHSQILLCFLLNFSGRSGPGLLGPVRKILVFWFGPKGPQFARSVGYPIKRPLKVTSEGCL
jgi:hypothetical protein